MGPSHTFKIRDSCEIVTSCLLSNSVCPFLITSTRESRESLHSILKGQTNRALAGQPDYTKIGTESVKRSSTRIIPYCACACDSFRLVPSPLSPQTIGKMSSAISHLNCHSVIRDRIEAGFTYAAIAFELQQLHPGVSGLSARSVRRYCSDNSIHYSSCLNQEQVDQLVEQTVFQVHCI